MPIELVLLVGYWIFWLFPALFAKISDRDTKIHQIGLTFDVLNQEYKNHLDRQLQGIQGDQI